MMLLSSFWSNTDSDGDHVPDGMEVKQGSNPTDPRDEGKVLKQGNCINTGEIKITSEYYIN